MTEYQWGTLENYVMNRLTGELRFELHPDAITKLIELPQPFWQELDGEAKLRHAQFIFNGHHWTSDGEPTAIIFERRS